MYFADGRRQAVMAALSAGIQKREMRPTGSTDMGKVALAMPSIHLMIGDSLPAVNHQAEFRAHCVTADAPMALIEAVRTPQFTQAWQTTNAS
jgi:hypothetical protein